MDSAKSIPLDAKLLKKYKGSPFVDILKQFERFNIINLPVGSVYKFRKGLQGEEKDLKKSFSEKLNSKFRDQFVNFISEEIGALGLAPGGGVGENLKNLKLDIFGPSTTGYIFEEILKIPTLTNAEKVAQYKSQSETEFFDMQNLQSNFAKEYGLPEKSFKYAEIKLGEKELYDGISKKFLNQAILEGGGADPKKFGVRAKRAAFGYIPDFSKNKDELIKEKKLLKLKQGNDLERSLFEKLNLPPAGNRPLDFPKGILSKYSQDEKSALGINSLTRWGDLKLSFNRKNSISLLSKLLREKNSKLRGSKNNVYDINEINSGFAMLYKNGDEDRQQEIKDISLSSLVEKNPSLYEMLGPQLANEQKLTEKGLNTKFNFKFFGDKVFLNAAKGYIPNFSELTGTGAGMMYQDANFKELGGGQSGKFLAPKSGEGFGQKIFYKTGSDKINQEYQVNKSIKDFEKENPALFAKNAISFTNVGKILTKNGLAAGFEREVIGGLGVDEFATGTFAGKAGQVTPKANFAFFLSELLAQSGVKNVVGEYRKKYGQDSLRIDDIYAQNFKVNDIMQKLLIDETNQFFKGKKNAKDSDVDNYIRSISGSPLINSLNEKFGSAGGRHTMFDTQGFAKNASKGYIPNFAKLTADILTVNPAVAKLSVDEFIEKYLGSEYSTGLSGTSANAVKISGNPQQMAEAKRDFIMSMLGPNFLATYQRDEKANSSRAALIREKSKSTGTRVKKKGGFMQAYGDYAQTDLSAALEGTFSGEAKRLNYEDLDTKAEKIFEQSNLTQYWNEIVKTMQLVGEAYRGEMITANNMGIKPDFDYNTIQVPKEGEFKYGLQVKYKAKDRIKQLTALIRPKLIEGLLEGEKGVQGLVLNQPEYDKDSSVQGDYFVLLDEKAAQLKKLVSNYLINPDLDPLEVGSKEQLSNKYRIREVLDVLDGTFGSEVARKGILLDRLKEFRKYSEGNPQLQKFFSDGENRPGGFLVQKTQNGNLGAFLKPGFPQSIIERMATVLAASYNRDGIFPLSNLDVGYTGQLSYEGAKNNPLLDTFATSPNAPTQASASSIPSTVRYGDYKNNKAYYDSIAKWKYDAASKTMVRQAAKGYIPNFAGATTLDNLKTIFKTVGPKLIEKTLENLFGIEIPDGTLSLETYERLKQALEYSNAFIDKNSITGPVFQDFYKKQQLKKGLFSLDGGKTWKKQAGNAFDGYVPNFAGGAIGDAFMREKMQSGLPDSQISLTQDSRLANNLNPSGFAVINKRDEPNGKVPSGRISDAYKNASRGFIPNFSISAGGQLVQQSSNVPGAIVGSEAKAAAAAADARIKAEKKITEKILEYALSINLSAEAQAKVRASLLRFETILNDSSKINEQKLKVFSNLLSRSAGLSRDQSSGLNTVLGLNSANKITSTTQANPTNQDSKADEKSKENGKAKESAKEESDKKEKKSLQEIAAKLFVFQSALSFASGAISSFGGQFEKVGEALNDAGQSLIAFTQSSELASQIRGEKKEGETGLFAGGGKIRSAGASILSAAGILYGTVQAVAAIDKAFLALTGTFKKSQAFVDDLDVSMSKYNIQLSDQAKKIADNLSSYGNVSGAGGMSSLAQRGMGGSGIKNAVFSIFGISSESNKTNAELEKLLAGSGFAGTANQDVTRKALGFYSQKIIAESEGNKGSLQAGEEALSAFKEDLKNLKKNLILKNPSQVTNLDGSLVTLQPLKNDISSAEKELKTAQDNLTRAKKSGNPVGTQTKAAPEIASKKLQEAKKKLEEYINKNFDNLIPDEKDYQEGIKGILIDLVKPTQDAVIKEERRKEALLFSADLLKAQLTSYQQISKIQSSIPTAAENQLSIEKELLTTTEARRMEIDRQIKSLSEQRQLTSDIKDSALTLGRERIDKYLGQVSGSLDVREGTADRVREAFRNLAAARNPQEAENLFGVVLQSIQLKEGAADQATINANKNITALLNEQLSVVKANSAARSVQNAMEGQNLAFIKQQNYEYNVRKEAINNQLTLEQKSLEFAKQRRDLIRETSDIKFGTSLVGMAPSKAALAQAQQNLSNVQTRPKEDLNTQIAQYNIAKRQSVAQFLFSKNIRPERVEEILNKPEKDQITEITAELNKESNDFATQVKNSAIEFYSKISEAAILISDKLNPNSANLSTVDKLQGVNLKNLNPKTLEFLKEKLESERFKSSLPNFGNSDYVSVEPKLNSDLIEKQSELISKIDAILKDRNPQFDQTKYGKNAVSDQLKGLGPNPIAVKEEQDKQKAKEEEARKAFEQANKRFTFKGGFEETKIQLDEEISTFENTLGKNIPMAFRDGMVSAMRELSNPNSTEPLKTRLLGVANAFLQKINEAFMTQTANKLTSGIMGIMPGMASGGYIKGGSGSKDDVPAMLMGGEYVIKKDAVKKYGPSFFEALNNGSIKKFASGGPVKAVERTASFEPGTDIDPFLGLIKDGKANPFTMNAIRLVAQSKGIQMVEGNPMDSQSNLYDLGGGLSEVNITKYQDLSAITPYGQRRDQGLSFNESGQVIGMDNYTGTAENKQDAMMRAQSDYYAKNAQTGEGGFYMPGQNGMGAIMGQRNLLAFATQQTAGTQFDRISGRGNAASIDIGAGSSNLSLFALRDQDNLRNAEYLQSKQKSLDLYFGGIDAAKDKANREEEIRKEQERIKKEYEEQKKKARKQLVQGIVTNIATSAAMAGIGYLGNTMSQGMNAAKQAAWQEGRQAKFGEGALSGGTINGENRGGLFNSLNSRGTQDFSNMVDGGGNFYQWDKASKTYFSQGSDAYNKAFPTGANYGSSPNKIGNYFPTRRAAGGYVAGNGMGDNVPTMLNGGEFVVSKQAAQNIGMNKLQQINSGNVDSDSSELIASKLDELVEKISSVGTINITVNSDGKNENESSRGGSENNDKQQKELARKIKEVVIGVLRDEKRLGGLLR
jgi:hypothetical protein